mmetsp:Transcript_44227/g.102161  ORF Transcript_44227/g.102161 Transcript_44227/m.102161 type:complete len:207 (+) Transcript_44227:4401-5021(+)
MLDSQGFPPASAFLSTDRVLLVWPPPHVLEHRDHDDQFPRTQSKLSTSKLSSPAHGAVSSRIVSLQSLPPCCAGTLTPRLRNFWPQSPSQAPVSHAPHSANSQSTGVPLPSHGGSSLHSLVSCVTSEEFSVPVHGFPPCFACVAMLRKRNSCPAPHVVLHPLQGLQPPMTQSTGPLVSQYAVSVNDALHAAPPFLDADKTVRVRPF